MIRLESETGCGETGPRYDTSYPGVDRFLTTFDSVAYTQNAAGRNIGYRRPLALHVQLPTCRDLRYRCACDGVPARDAAGIGQYLDYLAVEIELQAALFRADPRVVQMNWGGGTPSHCSGAALRDLFKRLTTHFDFTPGGEYSIEADRTLSVEVMGSLGDMGFNGISFPVQCCDPLAGDANDRLQDRACTQSAIEAAREAGFDTVQADLTYGLRRQTLAGFDRTLSWLTALRPDRIALHGHPHSCNRFALRPRIGTGDQPPPREQRQLLELAIDRLGKAGYVHVGLDQFALSGDALAVAQRHGRLYRGCAGYSTCRTDSIGLGVAATGCVGPAYSQNHRSIDDYCAALDRRQLPIARGIALDGDDLLRRAVIEALMCQFAFSKEWIETAYLIDFDRYFASEIEALGEFADEGLLSIEDGWIEITPQGRLFIPAICAVFDRYLQREREGMGVRKPSRRPAFPRLVQDGMP